MNRKSILLLSLALAVSGCGDDDRSGPDADVTTDGGPVVDSEAPVVLETDPTDGSTDVDPSTPFEATFSEAMGTEGTVTVRVEGETFDADVDLTGETLTVSAPDGWPDFAEVEIRIADDFLDEAGNALDRAYVFRFTTEDGAAPAVVATTPSEGATDVSVRLGAVRIRFDEPMDQGAGTVTLEGGPGSIDPSRAEWSTFEVVYPIEGLANATDYRLVLADFVDRSGNPATTEILGDDGAIDFTTRADDEAPQVVSAEPTEGQLDVRLETLGGALTVVFDEPMDMTVAAATLTVDGMDSLVPITWLDDVTASFGIAGVAQSDATHSLDLTALVDLAGNPLDPSPVVIDGRLDFVTGNDSFVPYVATSIPAEGTMDVSFPVADVILVFSEAMDTTIDEVVVRDELGNVRTVTGTWTGGGTIFTIAGSEFEIGLIYEVEPMGMTDLSGTPLSTVHPYLVDGELNFTVEDPTGASCDSALRPVDGVEVSPGEYYFDITREQRTRNNGSGPCDANGIADTDAVIHYVKTTPALGDPSGDGRALRVFIDGASNRANIDVLSGVCDPRDPTANAARLVCYAGNASPDQLLDVPAGDYYIWVSTNAGSPSGLEVTVSEVDAIPEGERCEDPYDTGSPEYTAPVTPDGYHLWDLSTAQFNSVDISTSNGPGEAISCAESPFGDVVIAYDKAAADTVLDVTITSNRFSLRTEFLEGGCTRATGGTSVLCDESVGTGGERFSVEAGAGTHYLWLAGGYSSGPFQGGEVAIRELPAPTAPGSSCASAIDITPSGTVPITPTHSERYFAPSCVPATSNVTWYAFDAPASVTEIFASGDGAIGLVDAATGEQVGCASGTDPVVRRFTPAGTRVCLAVETDGSIADLRFETADYTGPGLTAPVSLEIDAPADLSGTPYEGATGVTGDNYLLVTPTTLYQSFGTAGMYYAPRTGGVRLQARFDAENWGQGGTHIGEAIYTIDFNGSGGRLQQLTDAAGNWSPEYMDVGADYPDNTRGLTTDGTYLYTVIQESSSSTTRDFPIYRIDPSMPGPPEVIGRVDTIYYITGIALDDDYVYLSGQTATSQEGVYRVARSTMSPSTVSTPELLLSFGNNLSTTAQPMHVLTTGAGDRYLYVRDDDGQIHVIADPAGTSNYLGVLLATDPGDVAFDIDESGVLYVFSRRLEPEGQWYRYAP